MGTHDNEKEMLQRNPKVDTKVLEVFDTLKTMLPEIAKQKEGSNYNLEPPLSGKLSLTFRKAK